MYKLGTIILLVLFVSCSGTNNDEQIHDIIPVINLKSGEDLKVPIGDLFYAYKYDISLEKKGKVKAGYDERGGTLSLLAPADFSGLAFVEFDKGGNDFAVLTRTITVQTRTFKYKPKGELKELTLFGQFNSWDRHNLPMSDEDGDGVYEITVPLQPGTYQYRFYQDGVEIDDPNNPEKVPSGHEGFNSVVIVEEDLSGTAFLHKSGYDSGEENLKLKFAVDNDRALSGLSAKNVFALLDNKIVDASNISISGNEITVSLPKSDAAGSVLLRAAVSTKEFTTNTQFVFIENGEPRANNSEFSWYDGVVYSVLTDRFANGDPSNDAPVSNPELSFKANYHGGDFQGIIDKINDGYFTDLGVNTLWIFPANDNPNEAFREYPEPHRYFTGYHGYWPIHPRRVEEHFGDMNKLKELVETAHKNGLKVLLDFVSNHVHEQHPYYKNHPEFFGKLDLPDGRLNLRYWDEFRLTTWFEPYMPSFDYLGSEAAIDSMTANAVWWLTQTGADGFRHDAVKHVPNKFWRALTRRLKKEIEIPMGKKIYQIGETFGGYDLVSSYVNNGQLSSQFNFSIYDRAIEVFIRPEESFAKLDTEIKKSLFYYGEQNLMGLIMDSHDKNRYMAYADGDLDVGDWSAAEVGWNNPPKVDNPSSYSKTELFYAFIFTLPGVPVIYYGSEFGMTGASDPDNRRDMRFDDDLNSNEKQMLAEVAEIVKLRNEHPALRYGDFLTLHADENIFAYMRSDFNESLLVVLNKDLESRSVSLNLPETGGFKSITNLQTGEAQLLNGTNAAIEMQGISFKIFKCEKAGK